MWDSRPSLEPIPSDPAWLVKSWKVLSLRRAGLRSPEHVARPAHFLPSLARISPASEAVSNAESSCLSSDARLADGARAKKILSPSSPQMAMPALPSLSLQPRYLGQTAVEWTVSFSSGFGERVRTPAPANLGPKEPLLLFDT